MSVLRNKRSDAKAQYVLTAIRIFIETEEFCCRLSVKKQNMIGNDAVHLAAQIMDLTAEANDIRIDSELKYNERCLDLAKAKGALKALDEHMLAVYMALRTNPQGAFAKSNGESVPSDRAKELLDNMAESLGCLIDDEDKLLRGVLSSDKEQFKEKFNK